MARSAMERQASQPVISPLECGSSEGRFVAGVWVSRMRILLTEDQLQAGVARMANAIREHYAGQPLTLVGVMTGSVVLLADLMRQLDIPLRLGVVHASSYRGAATVREALQIHAELKTDVSGRAVLLVDDIYDTGHTLWGLTARMQQLRPRSVRSAVLLRKHGRQEVALEPDFAAFEIPDEFVVGYGLDYHDAYRNLPYVAALDPEEIEAASVTSTPS